MKLKEFKVSPSTFSERSDKSVDLYFGEVSKIDMITPDEEFDLGLRSVKGDRAARDKLIRSNLRFVISVAKQYKMNTKNTSLADLIGHGNEGLIIAVDRFDPTRGFKFITYAVWYIRERIHSYIAKTRCQIRVSAHVEMLRKRIIKYSGDFLARKERDPTMEELSEALEVTLTQTKLAFGIVNIPEKRMDGDKFLTAKSSYWRDESMYSKELSTGNEDALFHEMDRDTISQLVDDFINKVIKREKSKDLVKDYFKLGKNSDELLVETVNCEELGRKYGVSGTAVRATITKSIKTMQDKIKKTNKYDEIINGYA